MGDAVSPNCFECDRGQFCHRHANEEADRMIDEYLAARPKGERVRMVPETSLAAAEARAEKLAAELASFDGYPVVALRAEVESLKAKYYAAQDTGIKEWTRANEAEARATAAEAERDSLQRAYAMVETSRNELAADLREAEEALADIDRRLDIHPCAETGAVHAMFGAAEHCVGCQIRERIAAARRKP